MLIPRDFTGCTFERWTVIGEAYKPGRHRYVKCRCACGVERAVRVDGLTGGANKSCGCHRRDMARRTMTTHGLSKTHAYRSWQAAKARCGNPNTPQFSDYGGRGITVCQEWRDSFPAFLRDMGPCPSGRSLDRINNELGYQPGNCRWATRSQQNRNSRRTIRMRVGDADIPMADAAERSGLPYECVRGRLDRGETDPLRLSKYRPLGRPVTFNGETLGLAEWSRRTGLGVSTISRRMRVLGWSAECALTTPPLPRRIRKVPYGH